MKCLMIERLIDCWKVKHEAAATRDCYSQMPIGSGRDCSPCLNYNAAVSHSLPSEFFELAEASGIDLAKPAELCHDNRELSGLYFTGG